MLPLRSILFVSERQPSNYVPNVDNQLHPEKTY